MLAGLTAPSQFKWCSTQIFSGGPWVDADSSISKTRISPSWWLCQPAPLRHYIISSAPWSFLLILRLFPTLLTYCEATKMCHIRASSSMDYSESNDRPNQRNRQDLPNGRLEAPRSLAQPSRGCLSERGGCVKLALNATETYQSGGDNPPAQLPQRKQGGSAQAVFCPKPPRNDTLIKSAVRPFLPSR